MNEVNLSPKYAEQKLSPIYLATRGKLQGSRLGMETSFVIWDKCSVWYSPDIGKMHTINSFAICKFSDLIQIKIGKLIFLNLGLSITQSLFYIHKKIRSSDKNGHHVITSNHCRFGENSVLAHGIAFKLSESAILFF